MLWALLLALVVDLRLGEPAVRWHPVVWMGQYLSFIEPYIAPNQPPSSDHSADYKSFAWGAQAWVLGAALVWALFAALEWVFLQLPVALAVVLLGLALKPLLAWAMLRDEVLAVETALGQSLDAGRLRLARLVSRDVTTLTAEQVRESAIETLAENLNDSVVAPIFWFVLLGLPGAALYRFANTADAMWGYPGMYRGRYWQWTGKWAAKADDVLSWMPARITALLLAFAAFWRGEGFSIRVLCTQARLTPSPNSGWPMAAMAMALGVSLAKPSVYCLNAAGRSPQIGDIARSAALASKAWLIIVVSAVFFAIVSAVFGGCLL